MTASGMTRRNILVAGERQEWAVEFGEFSLPGLAPRVGFGRKRRPILAR